MLSDWYCPKSYKLQSSLRLTFTLTWVVNGPNISCWFSLEELSRQVLICLFKVELKKEPPFCSNKPIWAFVALDTPNSVSHLASNFSQPAGHLGEADGVEFQSVCCYQLSVGLLCVHLGWRDCLAVCHKVFQWLWSALWFPAMNKNDTAELVPCCGSADDKTDCPPVRTIRQLMGVLYRSIPWQSNPTTVWSSLASGEHCSYI